ncbi:MAG: amino acid adenylation domain-containing protein, partial [Halobacteriales archaeon]|nr:amino acid adenylation domain-containing protein [Halobacteriales archaeon]
LEARANRLARHLRSLGVRRGVRVGVCLERGVGLVVAELAILKADGAYVPLDAQYPKERLQGMAEDTRFPVLVTESRFLERLPATGARAVCLDAEADAIAAQDAAPLPSEAAAGDLAYIMFTSGSTGRPKGVAVPHRGIVRLVRGADYARMGPDDVFLQLAPAAFDASTLEVWGALLNGARLAIAPPGTPSTRELADLLVREKVSVLWLTAPLFHLMVDEALPALAGVRQLLAGGDALSVPHVRRALDGLPGTTLVNGYGPTENTTFSCCHRIPRGPLSRSVPIGRPIANSRAYVLDRHGEPAPLGIPGELFVAGDGLALGYWERPEMTAERFLPDPFVPGERMYRTGDLARWLPDGTLEFLGRTDGQVKVRGHRVETGEVESALAAHPGLKEVAVVARDGPAGKQLVAYLVPHAPPGPAALECRAFLRERLPDHMVPTAFVALPALPLGPTGKVDRRALPAPRLDAGAGHHPPSTPAEERLCAIWSEVLRIPRVGVQDNFFALGGHSLLATQVASRVQEAFGVAVSVRDVFAEPTIEAFARLVEAVPKEAVGSVADAEPVTAPQGEAEERPPLSHAQERLWFIDQLAPGAPTYNICFSLRLKGPLEPAALGQAFAEVERRHESLRTVFAVHDGVPAWCASPRTTTCSPSRSTTSPSTAGRWATSCTS